MTINVWIATIAGGFCAILLGALAIALVINADQRAELAKGDAARAMLQSQNSAWAQKTAATDAALAKITAADAANEKAIAKAESAAASAGKKLKNEAAAIAALKLTGSDCDQVTALGKTYLEHFR